MASIAVAENNGHATPTQILPTPSSDSPRLPPSPLGHATPPTDNHGFLSLPTPILESARNSLDAVGSPSSHTSVASSLQPPPSPTLSAHHSSSIRLATSTVLRDNNSEEHDELSSLKLPDPPPPHHRRKRCVATVPSVGSSSTEREYGDNQSFRLSPVRSAHSDATSTLPSPHTHADVASDAPSRPSSPASFLRKTFHRVRVLPPSPSGETDTGSDTARNDGQREDNSNIKRKGPELARPALSGLKQEADIDVHPFAFKPLWLASLVDPKSLETESMGGVDAILRALGTQPTYGLSTKLGPPPSHAGSCYPTFQDFRQFMRLAPKDEVILLSIAAIVSLSLGLFQDFGQPRPEGGSYSVTAVSVRSKAETASNCARNSGWANYKDTRNGTNLIPCSGDLKAILYSKSASEVITPRYMRDVVVFRGAQAGQIPQKLREHHITTPRDHPREHHETTSHDHRPASQEASQERNLLAPPNVVLQVPTRGRTASETTAREVDRDISGQPIPPSSEGAGQQQQSTAEGCPPDPSNGNGNGATGSDSFLRRDTVNRAEESTAAREGRANGMAVHGRGPLSRAHDRCRRLFRYVERVKVSLCRWKRGNHEG